MLAGIVSRNPNEFVYPVIVPFAWAVCSIVHGATHACVRMGVMGIVLSMVPERYIPGNSPAIVLMVGWQLVVAGVLSIIIRPGDAIGTTVHLTGAGRLFMCVPLGTDWWTTSRQAMVITLANICIANIGNITEHAHPVPVAISTFATLGMCVLYMSPRGLGSIHNTPNEVIE